jgi:hypothetical protein
MLGLVTPAYRFHPPGCQAGWAHSGLRPCSVQCPSWIQSAPWRELISTFWKPCALVLLIRRGRWMRQRFCAHKPPSSSI